MLRPLRAYSSPRRSFDQTHRAIGLRGDRRIMGHHDYSEVLVGVQAAQDPHDLFARFSVEVACRLVGQQHTRAGDQGPGDRGALHLAARQLAGLVPQPVTEADHVQQLQPPVARAGAGAPVAHDPVAIICGMRTFSRAVSSGSR